MKKPLLIKHFPIESLTDAVKLGALVILCLFALAGFYQLMKAQIKYSETNHLKQQLDKAISNVQYDNDLLASIENSQAGEVYSACLGETLKQQIVKLTTDQGYSGDITFLVAFNKQAIQRIEVVFHRETPGLGDKIEHEKSNWSRQFERPLEEILVTPNHIKLKQYGGQIDSIAGATITSNALSKRLFEFVSQDLQSLLSKQHCKQIENNVRKNQ